MTIAAERLEALAGQQIADAVKGRGRRHLSGGAGLEEELVESHL